MDREMAVNLLFSVGAHDILKNIIAGRNSIFQQLQLVIISYSLFMILIAGLLPDHIRKCIEADGN